MAEQLVVDGHDEPSAHPAYACHGEDGRRHHRGRKRPLLRRHAHSLARKHHLLRRDERLGGIKRPTHGISASSTRFPMPSTVRCQPGCSSVVLSYCSTTAGPASAVPTGRSSRQKTGVGVKPPASSKYTSRTARGPG